MWNEISVGGKNCRVRASTLEDELLIEKLYSRESEKYKNLRLLMQCTQMEIEAQPGVYKYVKESDFRQFSSSDVMRLERESLLLDIPDQDPVAPALITVMTQLPPDAPDEVREYLSQMLAEANERRQAGPPNAV
jgi:hypothetical protein